MTEKYRNDIYEKMNRPPADHPEASQHPRRKHPKRRRRNPYAELLKKLLLGLLILLLGILIGIFLRPKEDQKNRPPASQEITDPADNTAADSMDAADEEALSRIQLSLEAGRSVLNTLRSVYKEKLIIVFDGKYRFFPVDHSLKTHDHRSENVHNDENRDDRLHYIVDGEKAALQGIDVSSHQGEIDWKKVSKDGIDFAIIRALYRGYESGKLVEDKCFRDNMKGASDAGLQTGAYVFTQAINEDEVREEIRMLKELLKPYHVTGPIVVDVEIADAGNGRMDSLSVEERTDLVRLYCELIKDAGYEPYIYYNIESALALVDLSRLEDYKKWFAVYNSDFYYPYDYDIWQYSESGHVDGIEHNVDMDLWFQQ